jgi:sirohydrochlorin cobaltochelatase
MTDPQKTGVLLFAHGARDPNWALPFLDVAQRIRARAPSVVVELSFLEFMAPSLRESGDRLAAAGCTRIDVVPLFLGAGGHVRKDLPNLLDTLAMAHPGVQWKLRRAIGEIDSVIDAMALAALALTADGPAKTP